MGETSSQNPPETGMLPGIAPDRLQKGVMGAPDRFAESGESQQTDRVVVRIPKTKLTVSLLLNTKLLAEQRAIERVNEEIRRAGR
jgi:hypothetical protein